MKTKTKTRNALCGLRATTPSPLLTRSGVAGFKSARAVALALSGALLFGAASADAAPVILPTAQPTVNLPRTGGTNVPMNVTYHPGLNRYFASAGGFPGVNAYVWNAAGALLQRKIPINVDVRSFNYNANTGNIEAISFNAKNGSTIQYGLLQMGIDGSGLLTGTNTQLVASLPGLIGSQTMPAYDAGRNRLYSRETGSLINVVNRATGALISTITLNVAAAGSPALQNYTIGYDSASDVLIVVGYATKRAYVFNLNGSYVGSSLLPGNPTIVSGFGTGYTNGMLFVTDGSAAGTYLGFKILESTNTAPIANAGSDRAVFDHNLANVPTVVTLDGSGSSDPELQTLTYSWQQIAGLPVVALTGASTATPSFTAPSLADHPNGTPPNILLTFRLTVGDGTFTHQDDVVITVKHENLAPAALASAPASAPEGTSVALNGSASTDGDGDPLAYVWTQTGGTAVTILPNNGNTPTASFSAPVNPAPHSIAGEALTFTLTVKDGIAENTSAPFEVFIQNVNRAPGAEAGNQQTVCDDLASVMLSGAGSDPDGDPITSITWTQIGGPSVTLQDANTETPSFVPPAVAPQDGSVTLTFRVTVSDAIDGSDVQALTASDTVDVVVKHANRAPIADAGQPQTAPEQTTVTLDGTGSFDPDSDPIASYLWTQTGGTTVTLSDAQAAQPTFTTPDVGVAGETLTFELVVRDAPDDAFCGASLTSAPRAVTVKVQYVNRPPVLQPIAAQTRNEGTVVTLHAVASDLDGNPLTYAWSQTGGTAVVLDLTDPANPTFTAPQVACDGDMLTFHVVVSDSYPGGTASGNAIVNVANVNNPPVADAGPSQSVPEASGVALNATFSTDPDLETLTYSWVQTGGPAVTLSDALAAQPTFTAPLVTAGGDPNAAVTLTFAMTVFDGCDGYDTDVVEVKVTNVDHAPLADAGGSQSKNEATLVTLDASASSDPDGDALTYAWTKLSGPAVTLSDASSAQPTFTAPFVGIGGDTLVFQVVVGDGFGGQASDTVTIAVLNANTPPTVAVARASTASLWPPNHAMVPISIVGVQDPDNNATITITGVTQDEPTNGLGDGDTAIDAIIQGSTVLIRSERSGKGNGRVYHIHFTASDLEGSASGVVKVSVPHSKKGDVAIDGGALFNSTN